jgi:hypothetical protein
MSIVSIESLVDYKNLCSLMLIQSPKVLEGIWIVEGPGQFEDFIEKLWRYARFPHESDSSDVVAELCELYPDISDSDDSGYNHDIDLTNDDFDDNVIDLSNDDDNEDRN